jgi:hypothetical protein
MSVLCDTLAAQKVPDRERRSLQYACVLGKHMRSQPVATSCIAVSLDARDVGRGLKDIVIDRSRMRSNSTLKMSPAGPSCSAFSRRIPVPSVFTRSGYRFA